MGTLASTSRNRSPLAGFRSPSYAKIIAECQPESIILPVRREFWHSEVAEERSLKTYLQWVHDTQQVDGAPEVKRVSWRSFFGRQSGSDSSGSRRPSIRSTGAVLATKLMIIEKQEITKGKARNTVPDEKRPFDGIKRTSHKRMSLAWYVGQHMDAWTWYTKGWKLRKRQKWIRKHRPTQRRKAAPSSSPPPSDHDQEEDKNEYRGSPNNRPFAYWAVSTEKFRRRRGAVVDARTSNNSHIPGTPQNSMQQSARRQAFYSQANGGLSHGQLGEGDSSVSESAFAPNRTVWSLRSSKTSRNEQRRQRHLDLLPGGESLCSTGLTPFSKRYHSLDPIQESDEDVRSTLSVTANSPPPERPASGNSSQELVIEKYLNQKKRDTVHEPLSAQSSVEVVSPTVTRIEGNTTPPQRSPTALLSRVPRSVALRGVAPGIRARVERFESSVETACTIAVKRLAFRKQVSISPTPSSIDTSAYESYERDRDNASSSSSSSNGTRSSWEESGVVVTPQGLGHDSQGKDSDVEVHVIEHGDVTESSGLDADVIAGFAP